ncbi:MAG: tetratricopeptide repeat protein [Methylobacter sp.]|uniref:tetratricopeptide repeat protein n=1 Tax=Methylobacter sp. TaxID=2051955 RepID=UPI00258F66BD|nr:tetratricopeptide repeat protein [Methylobacter sp.]MCL7422335.1 tetratricopeptide repeat protein [Methylobacter sp.]
MSIKRVVLICSLPSLITGCADFFGTQRPAPVSGRQPDVYAKPAPRPQVKPRPAKPKPPTVTTRPLKESGSISTSPMEGESEYAPPLTQEPFSPPEVRTESIQPLENLALVSPSPAIGALVSAADRNSQAGNLESAAAALERAIRIEPRNAALFYKLAELRIKQSKPRLAEDLAKKSALLASKDTRLKRQSWLLIANARVMQKDYDGARAARAKAAGF